MKQRYSIRYTSDKKNSGQSILVGGETLYMGHFKGLEESPDWFCDDSTFPESKFYFNDTGDSVTLITITKSGRAFAYDMWVGLQSITVSGLEKLATELKLPFEKSKVTEPKQKD